MQLELIINSRQQARKGILSQLPKFVHAPVVCDLNLRKNSGKHLNYFSLLFVLVSTGLHKQRFRVKMQCMQVEQLKVAEGAIDEEIAQEIATLRCAAHQPKSTAACLSVCLACACTDEPNCLCLR